MSIRPASRLRLLVGREDPRDRRGVGPATSRPRGLGHPGVVVGADVADLATTRSRRRGRAACRAGCRPGCGARPRPTRPQLRVQQRRQLTAVDLGPEVARLAQRRRVERARLHALGAELAQPGAHLARGPRREGDREDLGGVVDAGRHAVGDAVGDRPGLARPGAGEHPHRPAQGQGDLALLGVEPVQHLVRRTTGGTVIRTTST